MGYGKKIKALVSIDTQNIASGNKSTLDKLSDDGTNLLFNGTAISGNSNSSTFAKGIEILSADPTGDDLWEGRMWIVVTTQDTTAPIVTNSLTTGTYNSNQSVTLSTNETATIYYTTDGTTPTVASTAYSSPISITTTTTLKYFAKDTSGNQSTVQSVVYTIDKIAPTVTVSPSGGIYGITQNITLSANETSTIYYTLDETTPTTSSSVYSSPINVSTTTTLKYFAVDTAGNNSTIQTVTYTIDTVAPTITPSSSGGTFTSSQNVTLSSNETGTTIYYTLDGSTPTTASTVYSSALTISSTSTLKFFGKDTAGNQSTVQSISFTINAPDTTAPIVTISPVVGTYSSTQSVTLSANETATIYYTLDGTTPTTASTLYSSPISISATTTLQFIGRDTAGNISTPVAATYTINIPDTTPPNPVTNLTAGTATSNSIPVSWILSNSGDVANYEVAYSSNGGSTYTVASNLVNASSTSYTLTGLSASTAYVVRVVAIDTSGNRSTVVTVSATTASTADTTPPISVKNLAVGTITNYSVALSWTASTSPDIDHYEVWSQPQLQSNVMVNGNVKTTSFTVNNLNAYTNYTFKVYSVDTSGNKDSGVTVSAQTASADTTPPNDVTNLTSSNLTNTGITLSWTASTSPDIASYDVYNGATLIATNVTTTTYNVTGLTAGTQYTFKVKSKDTSGNVSTGTTLIKATTVNGVPVIMPALTTDGKLYEATFASAANWEAPLGGTLVLESGKLKLTGTDSTMYFPAVLKTSVVPARNNAYIQSTGYQTPDTENNTTGTIITALARLRTTTNPADTWIECNARQKGYGNTDYVYDHTNGNLGTKHDNLIGSAVGAPSSRNLTDTRTVSFLLNGVNAKYQSDDNATAVSGTNAVDASGQIGFVGYFNKSTSPQYITKFQAMTSSTLTFTGQTSGQYAELLINGTVTKTATADGSGNLAFDLFNINIPTGGFSNVVVKVYTDNTKATQIKQSLSIANVWCGSTYSM